MELFKAHNQWANRPADERFESLVSLYDATKSYHASAREKSVPYSDLRTEANNGEVQLVGKAGVPAQLTHWSFGQLAARVEAPASYLRKLPATLAAQNLNHGLAANRGDTDDTARLMFHANGALILRAITSPRYERIWNYEVAERLVDLESQGSWEVARPDVRSISGDGQLPLYASDHDMFVFMRTRNTTVDEPGTDEPIYRGVIVENSEVGASALKLTRFLYRYMCGNHIIWGASKIVDLSIRHIGDARARFFGRDWSQFGVTVRQWADESATEETAMIHAAKERMIAATKDEVLDAVFGKRSIGLSRKQLTAGYDAVVPDQDGDPKSVWGLVQGLTRSSQLTKFADERTAIDKAAGKLLEVTF